MDKIDKYINDKLSHEELLELRSDTNKEDSKVIEEVLFNKWESFDENIQQVSQKDIVDIKRYIDNQLFPSSKSFTKVFPVLCKWAATILLPILLLSTFYFYNESNKIASNIFTIYTNKGENANITLPDGTKVVLNEDSKIVYSVSDFSDKRRNIDFSGEGYFEVTANKNNPFTINNKNIKVVVVGTKFNLLSRDTENSCEVQLDEGCVNLTSMIFNNTISLHEGNIATMDYSNGKFHIASIKKKNGYAWKSKLLIFNNEKLENVLLELKKRHKVEIQLERKLKNNDFFTGSLPSTNLNESLNIIAKAYHMNVLIKDGKIVFY